MMQKVSLREARRKLLRQVCAFQKGAKSNLSSTLKKMQGAVQSLQEVAAELREVSSDFAQAGFTDFQRQANMAARFLEDTVSSDSKLVKHVIQLGHVEQEQRKQDLTQNAPTPRPPEVPAVSVGENEVEEKKSGVPEGGAGKNAPLGDSPSQNPPPRSKDNPPSLKERPAY